MSRNLLFLCVLFIPYALSYAKICMKDGYMHACDSDAYCCESADDGCCSSYTSYSSNQNKYDFIVLFFIIFAVVSCCCCICSCCRRKKNGAVYSSGVTSTVVTLPPQTGAPAYPSYPPVQQPSYPPGQPSYPPGQPPYPVQSGCNPYYGIPPPEYQTMPHPQVQPAQGQYPQLSSLSDISRSSSSPFKPQVVHTVPVATAPPAI